MAIDYSTFTLPALQVVTHAAAAAKELGHASILVDHLTLGLIRQGSSAATIALAWVNITEPLVLKYMQETSGDSKVDANDTRLDPLPSPTAALVLLDAQQIAAEEGATTVAPEHILASLAIDTPRRTSIIMALSVHAKVMAKLQELAVPTPAPEMNPAGDPLAKLRALATELMANTDPRYKDDWERGHDAGVQSVGRQLIRLLDNF
ncbi:Clp protease N-terminal domain-containing protein [Arthrobacter sp. A2-55]|uniref:Clp protease N-terminal domain-containing protein n=1 Tax=Arthrobacter sp. A2-55 TaxID=2897337 RepID=UPI0021CD3E24|nr:Clp protease N-terminal domain-containing protein [Arthrobacter sp. A2-55]MCU6480527.1 hypothetical protein [Arthrobacter sp. A2-55]